MTTLVYRNGIIAADSQMTQIMSEISDDKKGEMQKLFMCDDAIIGICGEVFSAQAFVDLYKKSVRNKKLSVTDNWAAMMEDEFEAIVVKENVVLIYNYLLTPIDITTKSFFAMGSGSDVAYGALYMGATAIEAVKAASERNAATGFQVVSYSIKDIPSVKRNIRKKAKTAKKSDK